MNTKNNNPVVETEAENNPISKDLAQGSPDLQPASTNKKDYSQQENLAPEIEEKENPELDKEAPDSKLPKSICLDFNYPIQAQFDSQGFEYELDFIKTVDEIRDDLIALHEIKVLKRKEVSKAFSRLGSFLIKHIIRFNGAKGYVAINQKGEIIAKG